VLVGRCGRIAGFKDGKSKDAEGNEKNLFPEIKKAPHE
jgi:hypothetical protein